MKRWVTYFIASGLGVLLGWMTVPETQAQIGYTGGVTGMSSSTAGFTLTTASPVADSSIWDFTTTFPVTAGGETTIAMDLSLTNADHTGGQAIAFNIGAITGDAQATESAILINDGYDFDINFRGAVTNIRSVDWSILLEDLPAAGGSGDLVNLNPTLNAMDGSDTVRLLYINPTNADHSGASNVLNGLEIEGITGDAQATEIGAVIGSGWDYQMHFSDDSTVIGFGATSFTWSAVFQDALSSVNWMQVYGETHATGGDVPSVQMTAALGPANRHTILEIAPRSVVAMNGSDTLNGLLVDISNANHTGTGNTLNGFYIDGITADAQADEYAINIGAGWDLAALLDGAISQNAYRQNFDGPCLKVEAADFTTELVTDAAVNMAMCEGDIQMYLYRLDGNQASPFIVAPGAGLDLDNDGADNEGVEVILADLATSTQGWSVVGTSPAMYVKASITITSVSGTDNFSFGWRLAEAFVDDIVLATYDTYGAYHINDNAGNLQIQTGDDTTDGTDEEDQVETWGDAETHILEVQLATDGTFTFYIDGLASTITNASGAAAAGDVMYPFIGMLNAADADTELTINWIEVGEVT